MGDPEIAHLEFFDENVAALRDGPVASRFRVAAIAEAAFLAYKRQADKFLIVNGEREAIVASTLSRSPTRCSLDINPILTPGVYFSQR